MYRVDRLFSNGVKVWHIEVDGLEFCGISYTGVCEWLGGDIVHERTIIERAVQFEPPALSREEILFSDEGSTEDDDIPDHPISRPRPPNHPPGD